MKYTVLGAGMMGSAVAYDLATMCPNDEVVLADVNFEQAASRANAIGANVKPLRLDVHETDSVVAALEGSVAAVAAVTYSVNYDISRAAIETGVHVCDLGGNNEMVEKQMGLDADARRRGVTIVPNCGLAPGLINILAMEGTKEFDELDSIRLRVGGLPQHPRPPLMYQIVFSVDGLINEYVEPAEVIRDGKLMTVESLADLEEIQFNGFGTLEAFNTSGGISSLPRLLHGKLKNLDYKTIRYKGHCEKFRMLVDLGFASNEPIMAGAGVRTSRELFGELLQRKLDHGDKDLVLARATLDGRQNGIEKTLVYELVDYYDDATRMSAMMRTTAFPTSIIAQMLAQGTIQTRGVLLPEVCVPGDIMMRELANRNINIIKRTTTHSRN